MAVKTRAELDTYLDANLNTNGVQGITGAEIHTYLQDLLDSSALTADLIYRPRLSANRTYFVRTDGSDSNTGLVNDAGGAFATVQAAINAAYAVDLNGFNVTITIGAGTFAGFSALDSFVGKGNVTVVGAGATTILSGGNVVSVQKAQLILENFAVTGTNGLSLATGASVSISGITFGTCTSIHIIVQTSARLVAHGNYTITGNALIHYFVSLGGVIQFNTVTVTHHPAFSFTTFISVSGLGACSMLNMTFTPSGGAGSPAGTRYSVSQNAVVVTGGGGASYFPGNVAGTTATGGQYL